MSSNQIQDKFIKSTIYVVVGILLLGFILIQPYNLFCKIKRTCQPITLSSFSSHKNGINKMKISFTATIPEDLKDFVEFEAQESNFEILNGERILNSYLVKNLTEKEMIVGAHFDLQPEGIGKYLQRVECICFGTTLLNADEEKPMPVNFRIKPEIEKDPEFKDIRKIEVNYQIYLVE
ncbi:MAG: cytochrome c oxidase assembly protein subunit 11 [Rickettsiales bacterium]|jgi:cytochrome c oxidase assembly protein subunit 11